MHTRYSTSVIAGLAGGFVVVASQVFATGTAAWIAFGIGIGVVILAGLPVLFGDRKVVGLALDGIGGLLAVWTVVASLVFTGNLVKWLSFGEGAGFVLLAVGGLTLNQISMARRATLAAPTEVGAGLEPIEATQPKATAVQNGQVDMRELVH
jgi:hypothetical protein